MNHNINTMDNNIILKNPIFKMFKEELENMLHSISQTYDIDYEELKKLSFSNANLAIQYGIRKRIKRKIDKDKQCMGRKIDGKQCTRSSLEESEFCKSHKENLPHGRYDNKDYIVPEKGKRGRKKKSIDYNDGNYIATHLEMIDGVQYLVNEEGLIFSYNIESPIFIGQKTDEGTIKKIDGDTLTPTAITAH